MVSWIVARMIPPILLYTILGGGTGSWSTAVFTHLSPSSISMTGISSTIGYLRPQSLQMSHDSLCRSSSPSFSRTQAGQRRISNSSFLTTLCLQKQISYSGDSAGFYHTGSGGWRLGLFFRRGSWNSFGSRSVVEYSLPWFIMCVEFIR